MSDPNEPIDVEFTPDQNQENEYKGLGTVGKTILWTTAIAGALYMAMCAAPRHMGYNRADKGPSKPYTIKGKEIHFINGRVIECEDKNTLAALVKRIDQSIANSPRSNTFNDKARRAINELGDIAEDGYVAGSELPGGYRISKPFTR